MSTQDAYAKKLQAQLDQWRAEADKLQAKTQEANADTQIKIEKESEALREHIDQAQEKLNSLKHNSAAASDDLKAGLEQSWADLGEAVKSAVNRFN